MNAWRYAARASRALCHTSTAFSHMYRAGKSAERPVLSEETIERNVRGIENTLRTLLAPPPGRWERRELPLHPGCVAGHVIGATLAPVAATCPCHLRCLPSAATCRSRWC